MSGTKLADPRPLTGIQVIVTRAESADGPLSCRLAERGARVLNWPSVAFEPPEETAPLDAALARLSSYDWIVFTSRRAVEVVAERVGPPAAPPRVAAVGGSTADRLGEAGWPVHLVPSSKYNALGLLEAFDKSDCAGARILFPASSIARETLSRGLTALGAELEQVVAYRTVPKPLDPARCRAAMRDRTPSIVTFTSPSTVSGLRAALGSDAFGRLLESCPVAVIGETTAASLAAAGFAAAATARPSTLPGLVSAIESLAGSASCIQETKELERE